MVYFVLVLEISLVLESLCCDGYLLSESGTRLSFCEEACWCDISCHCSKRPLIGSRLSTQRPYRQYSGESDLLDEESQLSEILRNITFSRVSPKIFLTQVVV